MLPRFHCTMRFLYCSVPVIYYFASSSLPHLFLLYHQPSVNQGIPQHFLFSMPLSIPSLPLHESLHPTSVWGTGVDRELAFSQANYAGLCACPVLKRTREARASPLHQPHHHWLDSGLGSKYARERMAWPGPYAFNTGADVKRRPWTLTPLIPSLCPSSRPYYPSSCLWIASWTSLMEGNWHAHMVWWMIFISNGLQHMLKRPWQRSELPADDAKIKSRLLGHAIINKPTK